MKHTEDHNLVAMNLVHDPIREVAQDPLSRAGGAAGAADTRKARHQARSVANAGNHPLRRSRAVLRDELADLEI